MLTRQTSKKPPSRPTVQCGPLRQLPGRGLPDTLPRHHQSQCHDQEDCGQATRAAIIIILMITTMMIWPGRGSARTSPRSCPGVRAAGRRGTSRARPRGSSISCIALHRIVLHCTVLYCTVLHCVALWAASSPLPVITTPTASARR